MRSLGLTVAGTLEIFPACVSIIYDLLSPFYLADRSL